MGAGSATAMPKLDDSLEVTSRLASEIASSTNAAKKARAAEISRAVSQSQAYAKYQWDKEATKQLKVQESIEQYEAHSPFAGDQFSENEKSYVCLSYSLC